MKSHLRDVIRLKNINFYSQGTAKYLEQLQQVNMVFGLLLQKILSLNGWQYKDYPHPI